MYHVELTFMSDIQTKVILDLYHDLQDSINDLQDLINVIWSITPKKGLYNHLVTY